MMIEKMGDKIVWLGHDGFRIDGTKTVYTDPYNIESGQDADIVLVTHEHFGAIVGGSADAENFKKKLEGKVNVRIP